MILIDTSAWIEFFRGRDPLASTVDDALAYGDTALCGPVAAELRRGLQTAKERTAALSLLDSCQSLA